MGSYLILGAGKFGRLAVARLSECDPGACFVIVDQNRAPLEAPPSGPGRRVAEIEGDVAAFLREHLANYASWDWLVPAVPVHVALVSLQAGPAGSDWQCMEVPEEVEHMAPAAIRGSQGELYLSRAAHICPDDCPSPEVCPVTGESRTPALYEELAALNLPGFRVVVIPSQQLAPGVGGYAPRKLLDLPAVIAGVGDNLLLATACRCHGVVHALHRREGAGR